MMKEELSTIDYWPPRWLSDATKPPPPSPSGTPEDACTSPIFLHLYSPFLPNVDPKVAYYLG